MNEPDTTLDQRFSDPGAVAAGWEETRRMLEEAQLSWICTVRADGRPHLTPLVAVWLDGALYFTTGSLSTLAGPRLREDSWTRCYQVLPPNGCRPAA